LKAIEAENRPATPEEKAVLVKYTGWGAMSSAFASQPPRDWQHVGAELRELLSAEEFASARSSTPNAHYTSPEVIQAIWQAMERFGLQPGAQILEPSMGAGHFFGLMPESLYPGTRRTGVELDSITARIAAQLYPDSSIHAKAFEDTPLPIVVNGPGQLRNRHLSERATLVGAVRLPNTAFKANAGTEVTTDILFGLATCVSIASGPHVQGYTAVQFGASIDTSGSWPCDGALIGITT